MRVKVGLGWRILLLVVGLFETNCDPLPNVAAVASSTGAQCVHPKTNVTFSGSITPENECVEYFCNATNNQVVVKKCLDVTNDPNCEVTPSKTPGKYPQCCPAIGCVYIPKVRSPPGNGTAVGIASGAPLLADGITGSIAAVLGGSAPVSVAGLTADVVASVANGAVAAAAPAAAAAPVASNETAAANNAASATGSGVASPASVAA